MAKNWSIWDEMREMQSQMDNLFGRFFGQQPLTTGLLPGPETSLAEKDFRQPLADVIDKKNEIIARIEIPGIDKQDIHITTTQDGVEIKAEKKEEYRKRTRRAKSTGLRGATQAFTGTSTFRRKPTGTG